MYQSRFSMYPKIRESYPPMHCVQALLTNERRAALFLSLSLSLTHSLSIAEKLIYLEEEKRRKDFMSQVLTPNESIRRNAMK